MCAPFGGPRRRGSRGWRHPPNGDPRARPPSAVHPRSRLRGTRRTAAAGRHSRPTSRSRRPRCGRRRRAPGRAPAACSSGSHWPHNIRATDPRRLSFPRRARSCRLRPHPRSRRGGLRRDLPARDALFERRELCLPLEELHTGSVGGAGRSQPRLDIQPGCPTPHTTRSLVAGVAELIGAVADFRTRSRSERRGSASRPSCCRCS